MTTSIKNEVKQFMNTQPKQISEQTVPMIKRDKTIEKVTLPAVGAVHLKAPTFDRSAHWATYLRQFEAAACANYWTEKDKAVSLVLALKGPAAELLQKVPPDSQNTYAKLIKALELRYDDKHLRDVYYAQLRTRRQ